jgi:hypothetical protein
MGPWHHARTAQCSWSPQSAKDSDYRSRDNQTLVAAESPHFLTHLLTLALIPSFSHFFTTPDDTSSSEHAVIRIGTLG